MESRRTAINGQQRTLLQGGMAEERGHSAGVERSEAIVVLLKGQVDSSAEI
jgi:hypothetical protein